MADLVRLVRDIIEDAVEAEGFELVHIEYAGTGTSPVLRVYIDKPGGVSVSDCALISRRASVLLDVEDVIPSRYVLEVSSLGIERPLFSEDDYYRYRGKEIRLTTSVKIEDRKNFTGIIQDFMDRMLTLNCDGKIYTIPFEKIKKAKLVYRFD